MNKTAIKNFAVWARRKLISDITYRCGMLGVTDKGFAEPLKQSANNLMLLDVGLAEPVKLTGREIPMRRALCDAINAKAKDVGFKAAFEFIVEKAAYTWFNRLIAVRFMEINGYLPYGTRILSSEVPGKTEPDIVTAPFDGGTEFTDAQRQKVLELKDTNRLDELFRMLFILSCNSLNKVLPGLFELTDDYTELLLTISFTDKDGVLRRLLSDIPEDDFNVQKSGQVEIIGWLYQYYNTEPKDKVFEGLKKNIKVTKDNIPAATQLFTPDWIVRYMVENSLGRLWVEGHRDSDIKRNWKYYLEEAEQEPEVAQKLASIRKEYAQLSPEDIKVIDPCMGSGHILCYMFDVLMQIYVSRGWTERDAAQSIVENNLYGLDIDDRAAQLAYFAVMMKARGYDRRFLSRGIKPRVYAIQESNGINPAQLTMFSSALTPIQRNNAINQLKELVSVFNDAKEYGSILTVPQLDWALIREYLGSADLSGQIGLDSLGLEETRQKLLLLTDIVEVMARKYHAVVTKIKSPDHAVNSVNVAA